MHRPTQAHLKFIPRIYNTVASPESWADVLDEFAYHCGGKAATLIFADQLNNELVGQRLSSLFCVEQFDDYKAKYSSDIAAAVNHLLEFPTRSWIPDNIGFRMPPEEIPANQYMAEHFGVFRRTAARLNDTPIWADAICVNYANERDNMLDAEDEISQFFLPHFAKCVDLTRPFHLLKQRFDATLSVLDRLLIGVVVLDSAGHVLLMNAKARECVSDKNGIALSPNEKIKFNDTSIQGAFDTSLRRICTTDDPEKTESRYAVKKRQGELPWLVELFPLSDLAGTATPAFSGAAAFITNPEENTIVSTDGMRLLFDLTSAESEVCNLLAEGHKVEDIAQIRNVSPTTIKGQMSTLFTKTGTSSQAELIRMALRVNLPVERKS